MMEGNISGLLHPMREHGITRRCKHGNSSQHHILAKGHNLIVIPSEALFAERGIWARRAKASRSLRRNSRASGALPYSSAGD
jgi:hypothetical protein